MYNGAKIYLSTKSRICLPSDDKTRIMLQDVIYDERKLIEVVNSISLELGGKRHKGKHIIGEDNEKRLYKVITKREAEWYNRAMPSHLRLMKPIYETYYNEDQIIKPMLTLAYQSELIHGEILYLLANVKYHELSKLTYKFPKFHDYFCFSSLYEYLKDSDNFNNPKYLKIFPKYLELFQFQPQKSYITKEEVVSQYLKSYSDYEASRYGEMEFQIQQRIAFKNEKILSLKKTIE